MYVTTLKGSWVKLFTCFIQSSRGRVRISWERWIKPRDQNTAYFSEKKKKKKKRQTAIWRILILTLDACYWLHKVISISLLRFGNDRRCDISRFQAAISWFLKYFKNCLVLCLYVYFYLRVKEICSSYLDLLIINKKFNSNVWWTLLTGQGEGARTKSKMRNLASSLISVLFSLTISHYFANSDCLWCLWANESSIGKGKTDQKQRPGEQLQHNGNFTEATAAEINHDGVYVHWSERSVSILFQT